MWEDAIKLVLRWMAQQAAKGCCWRLTAALVYSMRAHERLEAWRMSHQLALEVYAATDRWPRSERFGVTAQLRRAAISVAANIAEGSARHGRREFARFLSISLGSLAELSYLLLFSRDRALCDDAEWHRLEALRDHAGKLVYGLYRRVRTPLAHQTPTD
jgi:four helix bundle protein